MNEPHPPRPVLRSVGALLAGFVLAGGVVGLALSIVGAVTTWDRGPDFGPHWYPLALVATAMPCAWAGGRLGLVRRAGGPSRP